MIGKYHGKITDLSVSSLVVNGVEVKVMAKLGHACPWNDRMSDLDNFGLK